MKIHFYSPETGKSNFGDELNVPIWNFFIPELIGKHDNVVFFGIGTILRATKKYELNVPIIVFGSGYHENKQVQESKNCKYFFFRGPLTAQLFGKKNLFITDPAILTPLVFPRNRKIKFKYGYMPHFTNIANYSESFFYKMNILYINPTAPINEVLDKINSVEIVFAEAMHAAIVADAYGVKWVPVKCRGYFNSFKWRDWSLSLELEIDFIEVPKLRTSDGLLRKILKFTIYYFRLKRVSKWYLSDPKIRKEKTAALIKKIQELKESYL